MPAQENQIPEEPREDSEAKSYEELSGLADSGELTEESLQNELAKYRQAIQEEFETSQSEIPENIEEHTKKFFRKNLAHFLAQIVDLSQNASSETVRLSASKFGIQEALKDGRVEGDPVKDLIKKLQKTEATK